MHLRHYQIPLQCAVLQIQTCLCLSWQTPFKLGIWTREALEHPTVLETMKTRHEKSETGEALVNEVAEWLLHTGEK